MINIEKLKRLAMMLAAVLVVAACGDDANEDNGGGQTNANRNIVTTDAAVARLEFPHLRGGNSIVLVHRTSNTAYDPDRVNYSVEWDAEKKAQRWSCYTMHSGYTGNYNTRSEGYADDPQLPDGAYWPRSDWNGGGVYDHGHICPNADRKYAYDANRQTYYMSNMQPQYHRFNGYSNSGNDRGEGLWGQMEEKLRTWVPRAKTDTLYVCKGGTIDSASDIIGKMKGKFIIPRYFFMAVLLKNSHGYRAVAFWAEQKNQWSTNANLADYAISIDELERKTGIDFFCNLPDNIENSVESKVALNVWGL